MSIDFVYDNFQEDTQDYVCSISPEEFERFCMEVIKSYAEEKGLKEFQIVNNIKKKSYDGIYQLDIYSSCTELGVKFELLYECKQYTSPVKREKVEILESRLRNLGMNKGVLLSTSGFQRGAIQFAKKHGISLIQVYDHSFYMISRDAGRDAKEDEMDPLRFIEENWPPYRAICFSEEDKEPIVLYPTNEIIRKIYGEANKVLKEQYGFDVPLPQD